MMSMELEISVQVLFTENAVFGWFAGLEGSTPSCQTVRAAFILDAPEALRTHAPRAVWGVPAPLHDAEARVHIGRAGGASDPRPDGDVGVGVEVVGPGNPAKDVQVVGDGAGGGGGRHPEEGRSRVGGGGRA